MQTLTDTMLLFWRTDSIFSNWHPAKTKLNGTVFENSEAAFMYLKAALFNDDKAMQELKTCKNPADAKKIGRSVKNFNKVIWDNYKYHLMVKAIRNKFLQNDHLSKELAKTGNRMIVEASPVDLVWGIGLAPDDPLALDPANWKGENLLDKALMQIRSEPFVQRWVSSEHDA